MSLVSDIQDLINDSGVFWPVQNVYDAANEAQLLIWGRMQTDVITTTTTVTATQEFITLDTAMYIPKKIIANNVEWYVTTYHELERDNRRWRGVPNDKPRWFVVHDAEHLRMWPMPNQSYEYKIEGVRYPPTELGTITSGTTTATNTDITARTAVKQAIVYTAAGLLAANTRPDLMAQWLGDADEYLYEARADQRKAGGAKITRFTPGGSFTWGHMGTIEAGRKRGGNF